jgi:hypothetical protein
MEGADNGVDQTQHACNGRGGDGDGRNAPRARSAGWARRIRVLSPNVLDGSRIAQPYKPTFLISADRSRIVLNHPHGKPMQLENIERIFQHKIDRFRTEALSKLSPVFNADRWLARPSLKSTRSSLTCPIGVPTSMTQA